jgi:hypothetical protein
VLPADEVVAVGVVLHGRRRVAAQYELFDVVERELFHLVGLRAAEVL